VKEMATAANNDNRNFRFEKTKTIDRLTISLIKKFLNYFWEIVDTLSYKSEKAAELYEKSVGEKYKNEYETFGISKDNKVLHIGCGAYPLSEIALAKLLGAEVVGIDKKPNAVKLADDVISKKSLGEKVKIEHGNGTNYPVNGFDVIIVSGCSLPKGEILENVFKIAKKQSTIIVRELNVATDDVLECINSHRDIVVEKKIHHRGPFLLPIGWSAIHLTKK